MNERRGLRTLEQVFWAAYVEHPTYVHPATGERISFAQALAHLHLQNMQRSQAPRHFFLNLQRWKRPMVQAFFGATNQTSQFLDSVQALPKDLSFEDVVVCWGQRTRAEDIERLRSLGVQVHQCEDGFLRSAGLGSDFHWPVSLAFDSLGLYADSEASVQSELIQELALPLTPPQLARGAWVRGLLRSLRLTKYNFKLDAGAGLALAELRARAKGRRILLVPGQVSDDVSMLKGQCAFQDFESLTAHLRKAYPDAFIVYRPHPEVVCGNRKGEQTVGHADLVETELSTLELLEVAREVHTFTSTCGLDALVRELSVHCWGRAWYAGWGLTTDHVPVVRARHVSIDALVYGAYVSYPRYFDEASNQFITPEAACMLLADRRDGQKTPQKTFRHRLERWARRTLSW